LDTFVVPLELFYECKILILCGLFEALLNMG